MWPGPYGDGGSRKYLVASLDQTLQRTGPRLRRHLLHATAPTPTPRSRRRWARSASIVKQGKALYAGISSYGPELTARAADLLDEMGVPLLIHQPSYSMVNRWVEGGLLDTLGERGIGCIAFSPLAQGMLTNKYLGGIPEGSRASQGKSLSPDLLTDEPLAHVRKLNDLASERGQSLAQLALAWALRDDRVTSVLIGASSVGQLEDSAAAVGNLGSATRSSRRSTATPSRRASTSGAPSPASPEPRTWARGIRGVVRQANTLVGSMPESGF